MKLHYMRIQPRDRKPDRRQLVLACCLALVLALLTPFMAIAAEPANGHLDLQVTLISQDPALCERELGVRVPFQLPLLDSYVDFVFIQDASGSFGQTMPRVKETLKQMVSALELGTEANGYPKDRAMLVTFQGSDGYGVTLDVTQNSRVFYDFQGSYFGYKITATPLSNDPALLNTAIDAISPYGATPTIDGMARAQQSYTQALSPQTNPYDRTYYLSNGEPRARQTVYFLITDGVANSGLYNNFPAGYKPTDPAPVGISGGVANQLRPWTWVYESRGEHYFKLYWNDTESSPSGFYYTAGNQTNEFRTYVDELGVRYYIMNPNGPYLSQPTNGPFMTYTMGPAGVPHQPSATYDPWEHYPRMLDATKAKAEEMKAVGGLPSTAADATGSAWFVSAYWEDINRFISGKLNGIMYRPEVRPLVHEAMNAMATNEDWFVSNSEGEGIAAFQAGLTKAFRNVLASQLQGSLTLNLDSRVSLIPGSPALRRQEAGGAWTDIPLSGRLGSTKDKLSVLLNSLPEGQYELVFGLTEDAYIGVDYAPIGLARLEQHAADSQGTKEEKSMAAGTVPLITANPNADCAPVAASVALEFGKLLSGRALKADEFSFTLKDAAGTLLERVSNDEVGRITFSPRSFSQPGVYLYTAEEVQGIKKDLHYDKTRYTAKITVENSASGLLAKVDYLRDGTPFAGKPVFTNRVEPPKTGDTALYIVLALAGAALLAGALALVLFRKAKKRKS